jgi:hypothetical protein
MQGAHKGVLGHKAKRGEVGMSGTPSYISCSATSDEGARIGGGKARITVGRVRTSARGRARGWGGRARLRGGGRARLWGVCTHVGRARTVVAGRTR